MISYTYKINEVKDKKRGNKIYYNYTYLGVILSNNSNTLINNSKPVLINNIKNKLEQHKSNTSE